MKGTIRMRGFAVAAAFSLLLSAAPTFAQAPAPRPAGQTAPAAPRPAAPAAPRPATPAAQQPAPAAPAAAAPAPRPFPEGVKYAFIYVQRIAAESAEGKAATDKVKALNDQKVKELNDKNKALQTAQQKLDTGGSLLNDAARAQLATDIDRQQKDIQRFTEDAQQDVQNLQAQLQDDFQRKLTPVIQKVATDRNLHMIFSVTDSGLVWGDPALDLTEEVITAFNATKR
jgi:outer membrane protein